MGCGYTGKHFGAAYEDGVCVKGFIWDADSDDGDGTLTWGGDSPCPACNTTMWLNDAKQEAEDTDYGTTMVGAYSGAMILEGALATAWKANPEATSVWLAANPTATVNDWPDRQAVFNGLASHRETVVRHVPTSALARPHTETGDG